MMKQKMMISLLFLMLFSLKVFSQKKAYKHPGFVITLKGEKIKGKFKLDHPKNEEELLSTLSSFDFRADEKGQKQKSFRNNLKYVEYTILGTGTKRTFERKKVTFLNGTIKSIFLPSPTIKGPINLYVVTEFSYQTGMFNLMRENIEETIYLEKEGKIYCAINRFLEKNLFGLIEDCQELAKKYDTTVYNYRNPETVVKAYNKCME